jgi:uncharacterized protein YkwD
MVRSRSFPFFAALVISLVLTFPYSAIAQSSDSKATVSNNPPVESSRQTLSTDELPRYSTRDICPAPSSFEQQALDLINSERAAQGLSPVQMDKRLADAALVLSQDMHDNCFLSHTGSNGSTFTERIFAAGYPRGSAMGEIAAAGYTTPQAVVAGWMSSSGHRANILNGSFTHAGVSHVSSSGTCRLTSHDMTVSKHFWNVDFGGLSQPAYTGCDEPDPDPKTPRAPEQLRANN